VVRQGRSTSAAFASVATGAARADEASGEAGSKQALPVLVGTDGHGLGQVRTGLILSKRPRNGPRLKQSVCAVRCLREWGRAAGCRNVSS